MSKIKKIDCVAITDHNEIDGAVKFAPFLNKHDIDVIFGEEIFTSEGEIIGLFLHSKIQPGLTPEETIKQIKEQGGIVYLPHPYDEKRHKTVLSQAAQARCASLIDCIEIHNGRNISSSFSQKQNEIANQLQIPKIIGGDSHTFFELGRNVCFSDNLFTKANFTKNLSNATFKSSKCHPFAHTSTKLVRFFKLVGKGDFSGIYRIFARKLKRGI